MYYVCVYVSVVLTGETQWVNSCWMMSGDAEVCTSALWHQNGQIINAGRPLSPLWQWFKMLLAAITSITLCCWAEGLLLLYSIVGFMAVTISQLINQSEVWFISVIFEAGAVEVQLNSLFCRLKNKERRWEREPEQTAQTAVSLISYDKTMTQKLFFLFRSTIKIEKMQKSNYQHNK